MTEHAEELAALARVIACFKVKQEEAKARIAELEESPPEQRYVISVDQVPFVNGLRKERDAAQAQAAEARQKLNEALAKLGQFDGRKPDWWNPKTEHQAEEAECAHMQLNELSAPCMDGTYELSLVGRIMQGPVARAEKAEAERDEALAKLAEMYTHCTTQEELIRKLRREIVVGEGVGTVLHANCPWASYDDANLGVLVEKAASSDHEFRKIGAKLRSLVLWAEPRSDDTSQDLVRTDADGVPLASYDGRVY